jgi:Ca-activated chloride channel family protein
MKVVWLSLIALCAVQFTLAQEENALVRKGNKHFNANQFTNAEVEYRKGLLQNNQSLEANFNLGNALFRQEKYAEALERYQLVSSIPAESRKQSAAAFHNAGNALLMQKKIAESIEAYKQALRLNPSDNETRYNLAFAQHLLKNDQDQQNDDQQDQKDNERKKDEEQPQQEQPQNSNMNKEQAEQLLQALMQDEQDTMEKAKQQPQPIRKGSEKDW